MMFNGPFNPEVVSNVTIGDKSHSNMTEVSAPTSTIPRSASYTHLHPSEPTVDTPARRQSFKRSFSENVLANSSSLNNGLSKLPSKEPTSMGLLRRKSSARYHPNSASLDSKSVPSGFELGPDEEEEGIVKTPGSKEQVAAQDRQRLRRSISGSISRLTRRSWISTPQVSAVLAEKPHMGQDRADLLGAGNRQERQVGESSSAQKGEAWNTDGANGDTNGKRELLRRDSLLRRKSRRPLSALISKDIGNQLPSVPPIPKSFSTDKLQSADYKGSITSMSALTSAPLSLERTGATGTETPRKRDELWSAFRNLDGDYQKFQSRPSTTKTAVVRMALLPFLRSYAEHASINALRPEDLDRRTVILNKWWTGLLEMLNGRNGESVSGNDRPAILEAVTALMVRPEWTTVPARPSRTAKSPLKSRSTTSLGSNMSDFLADSVIHNVRNTFTQNLLAQMAYVVDKMSVRSVPASVVTFCGKATAYAFFYCEGIAEILVRLWKIPTRLLRRIVAHHGGNSPTSKSDGTAAVSAAFPPCLHALTFRSMREMVGHLKSRPHLPIATAYINWHGPWVARWAGLETDLFYVFVKFYIDLTSRLLPESMSNRELITVPGWALVHAKLLVVLTSTLQRLNPGHTSEATCAPSNRTFDGMLGEADATATLLPLSPNSFSRSMAENRLVMLLRDCLSGSNVMSEKAQRYFADSFHVVLRVAASGTSIFDHDACFTLCDFLEEVLVILNRFHWNVHRKSEVVDWGFWLEVFKRFLGSHNSMTEVRLFAFLYRMWGTFTATDLLKKDLCLDWLLAPDVFHCQFNHWCPMVRAFYMRLVMWRIGRLDVKISSLNSEIMDMLEERLTETWSYYRYQQQLADSGGIARISTAPCSPAPSRCLLIARDDVQPASSGMFLTFEGLLSSGTAKNVNPYEVHSSRNVLSDIGSSDIFREPVAGSKGRWSILKSMLPFSLAADSGKRRESSEEDNAEASSHTHKSMTPVTSLTTQTEGGRKGQRLENNGGLPTHRALSYKFSLEWPDKISSQAGKERRLQPPRLPFPAELGKAKDQEVQDIAPCKAEGAASAASRYSGRALAEWADLIAECGNFFERRKAEGVPNHALVETPMLSVDAFRKI